MQITTTRVFDDNVAAWLAGKRRALNQGGTASSKTYSILQMLILIAEHSKKPLLSSIVSESLPHLKRGAIRDYFKILDESDHDNPRYNKTEQVYTFDSGSKIEFFGADEPAKVRGPRRDILFINEVITSLGTPPVVLISGLDCSPSLTGTLSPSSGFTNTRPAVR